MDWRTWQAQALSYAAALIPATLSGTAASILLGNKIPEAFFRRAVLVLPAVMGSLLLHSSLSSLL